MTAETNCDHDAKYADTGTCAACLAFAYEEIEKTRAAWKLEAAAHSNDARADAVRIRTLEKRLADAEKDAQHSRPLYEALCALVYHVHVDPNMDGNHVYNFRSRETLGMTMPIVRKALAAYEQRDA